MSGRTEHTPLPAREVETVGLTDKQRRARRNRSIALAVVLFALVALFYGATLAKLGANLVSVDAIRDL